MPDLLELDPVLGTDLGDRDVWARQVVGWKQRRKKPAPVSVDLERAIRNISITDTMHGSSTVVLSIYDDDWNLIDSGFFDADKDGRPDPVDVNYPEGSRYWWRLTQIGVDATRGGADVALTFMERAAVQLMAHHGPLKVRRSKKTRAEFLKMLADHVGRGRSRAPKIEFFSKELHIRQAIAGKTRSEKKQERDDRKLGGISPDEDLTIKGAQASQEQLTQVERALDQVAPTNAPELAAIAMLCAGIGESAFRAIMNTAGSGYGGVFQGDVDDGVFEVDDTEGMARSFLLGGKGFQAGGAIFLAEQGVDPGEIATRVEASGKPGSFYGQYREEAERLLEAYGGVDGGGATYTKAYHFSVGGPSNPGEDFWEAMHRLADEVNWALFLDGQRLYFDDEMRLIQQKPVGVFRRGGGAVVSFSATWDVRQIATEAQLDLVCDPFEFRAGQVVKVEGFGPASTGSTARPQPLPGRWLIEEITRERFSLVSVLKLKQPERPKREPRPSTGTRKDDPFDVAGPLRERIIEIAEASMTSKTGHNYYLAGGDQSRLELLTPGPPYRSDCSQWIYAVYKKAGAGNPGLTTYEMAAKGTRTSDPKPGDLMLTDGHVELLVDPGSGKTIGHGSPPIDYSTVDSYPGHWFVTYDFLNQDDERSPEEETVRPQTGTPPG